MIESIFFRRVDKAHVFARMNTVSFDSLMRRAFVEVRVRASSQGYSELLTTIVSNLA